MHLQQDLDYQPLAWSCAWSHDQAKGLKEVWVGLTQIHKHVYAKDSENSAFQTSCD